MTIWLIKRFIKHADEVRNPQVRTAYGLLANAVCIVGNILLCLSKGIVGMMFGSIGLIADAVNNLSDASNNIVGLLGFGLASRPADEDHPFGHGRYEYLAGLIISVFICAIGLNLMGTSIQKIIEPEPMEVGIAVYIVLVCSILAKIWMSLFNLKLGRIISSETLKACAADARNDVIATSAVLITTIISATTGINLDGLAGLGVGMFICWSGITLVREALNPLLGQAPDADYVDHIRTKLLEYPDIIGVHDLIVHSYGVGNYFASVHIEMLDDINPFDQHRLVDEIEERFRKEDRLILTIHSDPIVPNDPFVKELRGWLEECVRSINPALSIHDLRCASDAHSTTASFICDRPLQFSLSDEELEARIAEAIAVQYPHLICHMSFDTSYLPTHR